MQKEERQLSVGSRQSAEETRNWKWAIAAHVVGFGLLVLSGCATTPTSITGAPSGGTAPSGQPGTGAEQKPAQGEVVRPGPQTSEAVRGLLAQASQAARAGQLQNVDSLLERALRIEPRNPVLWHYLARLRLRQGRFAEARAMAAKSNSLAGDDTGLQSDNWRLIGYCAQQLGDEAAARAANARADQLRAP